MSDPTPLDSQIDSQTDKNENTTFTGLGQRLAVPEQGLPAMSYVSREDLSHWACFLLDPCQTFVESAMFDGESLVVDPQ